MIKYKKFSGGFMAKRSTRIRVVQVDLASATAKVHMWRSRAERAREAGRSADADRCDDKVRDWASRVRQIERVDSSRSK